MSISKVRMRQTNCNFFIESNSVGAALNTVKVMLGNSSYAGKLMYSTNLSIYDIELLKESKSLLKLLLLLGWQCTIDNLGHIVNINFIKLDQIRTIEDIIFSTIAPYVANNSFIEMENIETKIKWNWVFLSGRLLEQNSTLGYIPQQSFNVGYNNSFNQNNKIELFKKQTFQIIPKRAFDFKNNKNNK